MLVDARPTCCCTAMPSAPSSRSRTAGRARAGRAITDVRGTAFMRSPATRPPRAGSRSIPPRSTCPAASTSTSTPTRRPRRRPQGRACDEAPRHRRTGARRAAAALRAWPQAATGPMHLPPRERTVIRLPSLRAGEERPGAVRPRQPRAAPGDQPRQRPRAGAAPTARRPRDVWINPPPIPLTTAEMDHVFDLPYARSPHPSYADEHRRPRRADQDPGLGDDPLQREHHARLLRRLHLLLDHRARGPHHPEPQRGLGDPRDRGHARQGQGLHRRRQRPGRPHGQHVPHRLQEPGDRGRLPQAELRLPRHLPEPEHRPRPADQAVPPRARAARA
jgi:hypothetical protein